MTEQTYIAIAVDDEGQVWKDHFGIAPYYYLYDRDGKLVEKRPNPHGGETEQPHSSPRHITELLADCTVFIAGLTGLYQEFVERTGVEVVTTDRRTPEAALAAYLNEKNA